VRTGAVPAEGGPPTGLHRLEFTAPRPFEVQELRRLSPAADYHRSLIGARLSGGGGLEIWGIVQSGPGWIRTYQGGIDRHAPLPPALVVHVSGPGRLGAYRGDVLVAKLERGEISGSSMDVFASTWLPESFKERRAELAKLHEAARKRADGRWAPLDPDFTLVLGQQVVRRLVSVMRSARHGRTVIFVPAALTEELSAENRYVAIKYGFAEGEPRLRLRTLVVRAMKVLAQTHGRGTGEQPKPVGWAEYEASSDEKIAELDEAIFAVAHLIAALSAVDGAVVITKRFELLGFGAEISGKLPEVRTVARALDVEGKLAVQEGTEGVGTRHRSVYRLCSELKEAVAVVISQDGGARFVAWKDGAVTYWDQA
jgi:Probable sensor domain DACNV